MGLGGAGGYTMNIQTYNENLCLFFQALKQVKKEYAMFWKCDSEGDKRSIEHSERVFAYELYRQWENILEKNESKLLLNGEPGKHLGRFYTNQDKKGEGIRDDKYPDLVLHLGQETNSGNEIVCEIKRSSNNESLEEDLKKLNIFTHGTNAYELGILLIYGCKSTKERVISTFDFVKFKNSYSSIYSGFSQKEKILIVYLEYDISKGDESTESIIRYATLDNIK